MTVLKVATLNVNGINDPAKCHTIFHTLQNLNCDLIAIQETHITQKKIPEMKRLWPFESIWSPAPSSSSCGTAILLGPRMETGANIAAEKIDEYGRVVIFKTKYNEATIQITNIYAPNENNQRDDFFDSVSENMFPDMNHTILTGDFNMVEDPRIDRGGTSKSHESQYKKGIDGLNRLKSEFSLQDYWRQQNPERREFTWKFKHKKEYKASRLDRFYSSHNTQRIMSQHRISQSDHAIVVSRYNLPTHAPRGPGYWKFNKKVLAI